VAGIVDGEGSICLSGNQSCHSYNVDLIIPNTSLKLMKWLIDNFGGRYNVLSPKDSHGYNRKPLYKWRPAGKKNRENFLLGILPYLVIKSEQAKVMLEWHRLGYNEKEKRQELMSKCRLLNQGDESVETNTQEISDEEIMRESGLISDNKREPVVTQGTV
jgi:hypothetical protein